MTERVYEAFFSEVMNVFKKYNLNPNYFFNVWNANNEHIHDEIMSIIEKYCINPKVHNFLSIVNDRRFGEEKKQQNPQEESLSVNFLEMLRNSNQPEALPTATAVKRVLNTYLNEFNYLHFYSRQNGSLVFTGTSIFTLPTSGKSLNPTVNSDYIKGKLRYNQIIPTQLRLFITQDGTCYYANGLHAYSYKWLTASGINLKNSIRFALDPTEHLFAVEGSHVYRYSPEDIHSAVIEISDAQACAVADLYRTAAQTHIGRIPPFIDVADTARGICTDFGMSRNDFSETINKNKKLFERYLEGIYKPQTRKQSGHSSLFDLFNSFE